MCSRTTPIQYPIVIHHHRSSYDIITILSGKKLVYARIMLFTSDMFRPLIKTINALPSVWRHSILGTFYMMDMLRSCQIPFLKMDSVFYLILLNICKKWSTHECNFSDIDENTTRLSKRTLFTAYILM